MASHSSSTISLNPVLRDERRNCSQKGESSCSLLHALPEDALGARKVLDLLAHDVDAALVGRVELEGHRARGGTVERARQSQDRRGLARAGRTVEEQVRQPVFLSEARNCEGG